jgi:hypothetical protein
MKNFIFSSLTTSCPMNCPYFYFLKISVTPGVQISSFVKITLAPEGLGAVISRIDVRRKIF